MRWTNEQVKEVLTKFRNDLRDGATTVAYRINGKLALLKAVSIAFGYGGDVDVFNTENFAPQTFRRFGALFDVPRWSVLAQPPSATWDYPSQDETATAIQNFINRRKNPWAHISVSTTEADPIASEIASV